MKEYNWMELIKLNIEVLLSKKKLCKEKRKKYRKDIMILNLPVNSSVYCDLTPEAEVKNGEEYIKALHWAIKNDNIKNIALAGPYGSGKSSIIQTYMNRFPSTKALNISLATFGLKEEDAEGIENQIELGILKQLFYKVDSNKIPQSRYRKLKKKYFINYFFGVLGIAIVLCFGLAFFYPPFLEKFITKVIDSATYYGLKDIFAFIYVGFLGLILIASIAFIAKWITSKFKIKEINIADKATIADDGEVESVFDRAMDEIVYFFEATDFSIVFIEDLDRFKSTEIFVKLRELNTILNNYELIKRRIVFVYAIKDDMFENDERTKFFDFIIPVIPIINSTNSGEILREKLGVKKQENGEVKSDSYNISAGYITLVAPFIEDMRVLTSICNEFVIYKNTLNNVKLHDEKMFSMMIFKNLYPKEFSDLEAECGIVKMAFADKQTFVKRKKEQLLQQIKDLETKLENIENDILREIKEVKAAMLNYLAEYKGAFTSITVVRNSYSYSTIMNDGFDTSKLNQHSRADVYIYNVGSRTIDDLAVKINAFPYCYLQRIQDLKDSDEERKEYLRKQIEKYNVLIQELQSYSLKQLLERYDADDLFSEEVKKNKFLIFLLRKGFINENYADYINYFHPNSISKDEMDYIRGIRMYEGIEDFAFHIRNVAEVVDRIEYYEFKQKEALNFDVLDYLLIKKLGSKKCKEFIAGISQGTIEGNNFIKGYISRNSNLPIFIKTLSHQYVGFVKNIAESEVVSETARFYYYALVFRYADLDDIEALNNYEDCDCISYMLVSEPKALAYLVEVPCERMLQVIERLSISFVNIDVTGVNDDVLNYIFENNLYQLNLQMQRALYTWKYPETVEKLETENYTVTQNNVYTPFLNRIHNDFENYVSSFVIALVNNTNESILSIEDILERLIENNIEMCKNVIDKFSNEWNEFPNCCLNSEKVGENQKQICEHILKNNRIKSNWRNYLSFYNQHGITNVLIDWFESNVDLILADEKISEITDDMILELLTENISLETFKKIVCENQVSEFNNEIEEYESEQLSILIENKWIPFTLEILEKLKAYGKEIILQYSLCYKDDFLAARDQVVLDAEHLAYILSVDVYNEQEKVQLLDTIEAEELNIDIARILRNIKCPMKKEYVETAWDLLPEEERYELLINQIKVYTVEEISIKFSELAPIYKALSDVSHRHKETLPVTSYNRVLLEKLLEMQYITSFDEETEHKIDYWTKQEREERKYVIWVKQRVALK